MNPTTRRRLTAALPLAWASLAGAGLAGSLILPPPDLDPAPRADPQESRRWVSNPVPRPAPLAPPVLTPDRAAAFSESLEARAGLRAYEGAPPVIPHAIKDLDLRTCRTCHATGLRTGDQLAHAVSHTHLANCTQCHVEAANHQFAPVHDPANSFAGIRPQAAGGFRALSGSPPNIPHTTFMRTNCASCHGPHGYPGLQPDHLDRLNCVQCHALNAEFDQLSPAFNASARENPTGEQRR